MKSLSKSILSEKILKREAVSIKKGVNLSIQLVAVTSTGRPASVSRSTALSCTTPRATRARPASRPDEQEHKQKHYEQNKEKASGGEI